MRWTRASMHRYGEADFDEDYLKWGFAGRAAQTEQAESALGLFGASGPQKILDIACGIGTHANHWAQRGHSVLGVDISKTFIREARRAARGTAGVTYLVCDIRTLDLPADEFTVATWIEVPFSDPAVLAGLHGALRPGGRFICDVRNPEHPAPLAATADRRTWREEDGVFILERHEVNLDTGKQEDAWIVIDTQEETIEEKSAVSERGVKTDPEMMMSMLRAAGFHNCELRTMSGAPFRGGAEPYWLWLQAYKTDR